MTPRQVIALVAALLLGVAAWNSVFIIDEAEQGIIVQFGEPKGDVINKPGLHWRVPFIQEVRRFDKRLLVWDGDISQIPTLGREFIIVDTTARSLFGVPKPCGGECCACSDAPSPPSFAT